MSESDFMKRYGPWALIAGGSEGVGAAFARRLAANGLNLLLVARKPEPLAALATELRTQRHTQVRTLALDLTASNAIDEIRAAAEGLEIGMLIHNAGSDTNFVPFLERTLAESERMITLNVVTQMTLVRHFAPAMVKRKKGGIILMSSMASMAGYPRNLVYAASKAFSNVFAEGLWHDLGKDGVHVLGMILGFVATPAMARLGFSFDGPNIPAEPYAIADEALLNIDKGPTVHANGLDQRGYLLRGMQRAEAVRMVAGQANKPKD